MYKVPEEGSLSGRRGKGIGKFTVRRYCPHVRISTSTGDADELVTILNPNVRAHPACVVILR